MKNFFEEKGKRLDSLKFKLLKRPNEQVVRNFIVRIHCKNFVRFFLDGMKKPQKQIICSLKDYLCFQQNLVSFKARLVARENIQHFFTQAGFHYDALLLA